ncbi:MAG: hypothetical protein HYV96_06425 [Opitutae bacterium]|nr:hypothetical protein [Opitutae bacterium]
MSATANTRRVLSAILVIVLAGAGWWLWSERMTAKPDATAARRPEPFVQIANSGGTGVNRVLQERAEFFDPSPMFLPTARNAGHDALPSRLVAQPGQIFADFAAKWNVAEANLPSYGADVVAAAEGLVDVMARANEAPFAGFGESGGATRRVEARAAFIEVKSMRGSSLISQALAGAAVPREDFAPLEFLATISAAGLTGEPLLVSGSGADEVDNFFRDYLARTFRLGERLAPGVYRIVIGP